MNDPFQLVTNCTFKGKDYLVQMCVLNSKKLELIFTDKLLAEVWQCEYDASWKHLRQSLRIMCDKKPLLVATKVQNLRKNSTLSYSTNCTVSDIEALTHKTGNFKQFDVFVSMIKSGLLKTSDSISLDFLTLEDLEQLRSKKIINSQSSSRTNQSLPSNKRYLIVTYSVEFDRIHYPLPLEYCGPPDPSILQSNIRKLESEVERLKQKNLLLSRNDVEDTKRLKQKIQNLIEDNAFLTEEIYYLKKQLSKKGRAVSCDQVLVKSLRKLEEQVVYEKNHNRQIIFKLRSENMHLKQQVEELKKTAKNLKLKLKEGTRDKRSCRRILQNCSRGSSLDRKPSNQEPQIPPRPVSPWISSSNEIKTLKKSQNRFLSSSSSETDNIDHRARSRDRKPSPAKGVESYRKSSNERSRHSSEDAKEKSKQSRGSMRNSSPEGKNKSTACKNVGQSQAKLRSRESSLSSRCSSKQSKVSRFSNRGSGDCRILTRKRSPRDLLLENEDVKFTMSDLETRIHALQRLLSEGLNF